MFKVNNRNTRKVCEMCEICCIKSFHNIKFATPSGLPFLYLESLNIRTNVGAVLIAIEIFCGIINYVKLRC